MTLKEKYQKQIIPALKEKFGYKNNLETPRLVKVVVNIGVGKYREDNAALQDIENDLTLICGQKAVKTFAKKAISAFKTRKGSHVGFKVTLRGNRMYDFTSRLVNLALPRTRDFRGLDPKAIDQAGNLSVAIKEHIVFPEISHENVRLIFGLEAVFVSSAKTREEALEFFRLFGFPLRGLMSKDQPKQ